MFASMSVEGHALNVTVKLTAEEREIAYLLPYVSRAHYAGRYGWVTARVADEELLENALEWLRESYWLKAPTHLKAAVEGDGQPRGRWRRGRPPLRRGSRAGDRG